MTEVPLALPTGWDTKRVGDVLTLRNGYPFKPTDWATSGRPIIRIQNLRSKSAAYNHYQGELPDRFKAKPGDLLFAWSGTPGTSFGAHVWNGPEAWVNQHIFRVDFSQADFDRDFLMLALNYNLTDYINQAQGGVGLAHITKAKLDRSLLVHPPLSVQQAIAASVARHGALRSKALSRLATAERVIKRIRQSALAQGYRDAVEAGTEYLLEDLLATPMRNGYSAKPVNYETPFRVLTLTATTSGSFDTSQFKYTAKEFEPESPFWVRSGDILIQRGNTVEYVGMPALYEGPNQAYLFPDLMIRVHVRPDLDARFVWYMLLSPQLRSLVRDQATGSAGNMPKINQKVLNAVPVPVPDTETQRRIIDKLDATIAGTEVLAKRTAAAARHIERTSQSILAKAFRGELTPHAEADDAA